MSSMSYSAYTGHYVMHRRAGGTPADYVLHHRLPLKVVNKLETFYQKTLKNKASSGRTRRVSARTSA